MYPTERTPARARRGPPPEKASGFDGLRGVRAAGARPALVSCEAAGAAHDFAAASSSTRARGIVRSRMRSAPEGGRWYAYCVDFKTTPRSMRPQKSRQTVAHYLRIASLPPAWGTLLDDRGAPYYLIRWIAWGKMRSAVKARYEDAVRFNTLFKQWPNEASLGSDVSLADLTDKLQKIIAGTS